MKKLLLLCACLCIYTTLVSQNNPSPWIGVDHSRGDTLRTLRLAVSCTGEFTTSVGGVANASAMIDNWLVEINEMYGREYCVRFELIPNNNTIIYPNAGTDPWPTMLPGSGCDNENIILDVQAAVIDNAIGAANYDISHVILDPAILGGGCAGSFKSGYSGGFDIPVTRHEIGHQFSQPHTIENGGNDNFELSGGNWSVQGGNQHGYAHSTSYHVLANTISTVHANTGTKTPTNNSIPTADAGPDLAIPIATPFTLTGMADDADPGDQLTYIWDCMDGGIDQGLPMTDESQGALFMRMLPSTVIDRTIPDIDDIVNNLSTTDNAHLSHTPRDMNVKLVVNDNHKINVGGQLVNASGIAADDKKITIVDNGGPFLVTYPNTALTLTGGTNTNVTWNVNGTNLAPINTANVKISLSYDGGFTYPVVLAANTPNDGIQSVTIPNINTTKARIKVAAIGNIFFDISNADFTINQNTSIAGIGLNISGGTTMVSESGQSDTYNLRLFTNPTGPVTLQLSADSESEISLDGVNYTPVQLLILNNTVPKTVFIRGRYDLDLEGPHTGTIVNTILSTEDNVNYPTNLPIPIVSVSISDAQMAPVVGVDFDVLSSIQTPDHWAKIEDVRNGSAINIPMDDGTPTTIGVTTTATNCGVGGCAFSFGLGSDAQHVQSLQSVQGVSFAQGPINISVTGLEPNKDYNVYIFAINFWSNVSQDISINGAGSPVTFYQNIPQDAMGINEQQSSAAPLQSFAKVVTSTGGGTFTIDMIPNNSNNNEVTIAGLAIQAVPGPPPGHCPSNYVLSSNQNATQKYETDGSITSTQSISGDAVIVTYDAMNEINLNPGFEVELGTIFELIIDGCYGQ